MKEISQFPKTVSIYEIDNIIEMDTSDFIDLVEILENKIVFKTEKYFFIVIEGFSFGTWHYESYKTYKEFSLFYKKLVKSDLDKPIDILRTLILKIDNIGEFKEFLNTEFHDAYTDDYYHLQEDYDRYSNKNEDRFEMFLDAKSKGFDDIDEYSVAMKCGVPTYDDYTEFKDSTFFGRYPDKRDYKNFLKFKAGGFPNKESFIKATDYGFDNYTEYINFKKSGCYDKKEYEEYFKILYQLPDLNQEQSELFLAIIKDTKKAFHDRQYGEFFRLKYIFFEKFIDILYNRILNKQFESDKPLIEVIVNEIKQKIGKEFNNYQELKEWRQIRNKFTHEHYVIDEDKANEAKAFFNDFIANLLEQVNNFLNRNNI